MAQAIFDDSLQPAVDRLQTLVTDLWYPSETDAPVTVVVWPIPPGATTPKPPGQADGIPPALATAGAPITDYPADHFFHPILSQPFWRSSQGEYLAQRYQDLQAFLQTTLSNLHTYRLGEGEIALYLVGHHPSGHYLGVQTQVVET
jgi:hypothetical protein